MPESMKLRHIRVDDALWHKAMARAQHEGTSLSAVIRDMLAEYGGVAPSVSDQLERIIVQLKEIRNQVS